MIIQIPIPERIFLNDQNVKSKRKKLVSFPMSFFLFFILLPLLIFYDSLFEFPSLEYFHNCGVIRKKAVQIFLNGQLPTLLLKYFLEIGLYLEYTYFLYIFCFWICASPPLTDIFCNLLLPNLILIDKYWTLIHYSCTLFVFSSKG